ncbi:hypothetical protein DFH09DRAFT_1364961 [Mycena vulgaris]|nr:hypothetical protein DFH09DRAFT_1364961 [Mycena vulgaris]
MWYRRRLSYRCCLCPFGEFPLHPLARISEQHRTPWARRQRCVHNSRWSPRTRTRPLLYYRPGNWKPTTFFKTKSDSELVMQLYKHEGLNLLTALRGEFAFVLYDSKRRLPFAVRDRFGIKPLYYTVSDERILIASEIKAFLPLRWKTEWDNIDSIVHTGDFSDNRTVFKGVRKLMAGHFLVYLSAGYLKIQAYWDLSYNATNAPNSSATVEEMIETIRALLFRAIYGPTCMYLSGCIDCSAIAGMTMKLLKEKDPNAKRATFTLAFPHAGSHDEGPKANRTAAFIDADARMVQVTESDLIGVLEQSIWHAEQPIFLLHAADEFLISKFVHDKGYKVVLSGEGANEFFGGYAWLSLDYLRGPDPAGRALGLELPSDAERQAMLNRIQLATVPQLSLSKTLYTDAVFARRMLGGISTHRAYVSAGAVGPEVYNCAVLGVTGNDGTLVIAERIDARVREKTVRGEWHPLDVASCVTAKTILMQVILNNMGERMEMATPSRAARLSWTITWSNISILYLRVVSLGQNKEYPEARDYYLLCLWETASASLFKDRTPHDLTFFFKYRSVKEAVKPYVTKEIFLRKKLSYNAPPIRREKAIRSRFLCRRT